MEQKKMLPIGVENFVQLRTNNFYYVDKTGLIRDLLNTRGFVNLFTRPRRFGKSMNMSMLQSFFEIGTEASLFDGLEISKEEALCEEYLGKYPVVSVSFKAVEGLDFPAARAMMVSCIFEEARRLDFLADSDRLSAADKEVFSALLTRKMDDDVLIDSIRNLTELLEKHFGKKAIILIDEYDVPLAKANAKGYYKPMVNLIRGMFHQALKTNSHVAFSVMTGCLRVSKESIFTGLNNPKIYSLLDAKSGDSFGFTDGEVRRMLEYYDLSGYYDLTKEWYDGYQVGNFNVYNPWDVVNWCDQLLNSPVKTPQSYWANSSGNEELERFIRRMGNGVTKAEIEKLICGQTIQKEIEEQLTYNTMYDSIENMWSLLFSTGYLTQSELPEGNLVRLTIPNLEVRYIFSRFILKMFENEVAADGEMVSRFCNALKNGDVQDVENLFTQYLSGTVGIRDTAVQDEFKEHFYHGALLGILAFKSNWGVSSNKSAGDGFYDILIEIEDEGIGIIIETKYAKKEQYDAACSEALKQINDKDYDAELREDEMQTILKYGIACYKRRCRVVLEREL